jgi:protein involved in polysaccharide export with SLBB domain
MRMKSLFVGLSVLFSSLTLLAQSPPAFDAIKLGPLHSGDWLQIRVQEPYPVTADTNLNMTFRVLNDGSIDLPILGRVPAAGLTVSGLRQALETRYAAKDYDVTVTVIFMKDPPRWVPRISFPDRG